MRRTTRYAGHVAQATNSKLAPLNESAVDARLQHLEAQASTALQQAASDFEHPVFPCALIAGDVIILHLLHKLDLLKTVKVRHAPRAHGHQFSSAHMLSTRYTCTTWTYSSLSRCGHAPRAHRQPCATCSWASVLGPAYALPHQDRRRRHAYSKGPGDVRRPDRERTHRRLPTRIVQPLPAYQRFCWQVLVHLHVSLHLHGWYCASGSLRVLSGFT
jgi:hypothetical protein